MNDLYYISHGGPGSGRYPLGSGDRPYQKFEGSRRRSGSLLGYIRERRQKKAEEDELRRRVENNRNRAREEQQRRTFEAGKQRAVRSGTATDVMKYQGQLSYEELRAAYNRLDMETKLRSMSKNEIETTVQKIDNIMTTIKAANTWVSIGTDSYNSLAAIYNSTDKGRQKPLPIVKKPGGGGGKKNN